MKTTITLLNKTFTVSEKLVKEGVRFPNTDVHDQTRHNQFKITIKGDAGRVSFEYFCDDMGYDSDSRKAEKIYKACVRDYKKAIKLFDDVTTAAEQISEIANA